MGLIYPSASGWITARSEQGKITTQNSLIILPQKIDKVNKVLLHLPNQNIEFDDRDFDIIAKLSDIYFDEQQTTSLENLDVSKYIRLQLCLGFLIHYIPIILGTMSIMEQKLYW